MLSLYAVLIDGAIYASWLFLVAAGLTVIYGVMRILNMAHGSFYAIGAYAAASLVGWYFNNGVGPVWVGYLMMLGCALAAGLVVGLAGTGDGDLSYTNQSMKTLLNRLGVNQENQLKDFETATATTSVVPT